MEQYIKSMFLILKVISRTKWDSHTFALSCLVQLKILDNMSKTNLRSLQSKDRKAICLVISPEEQCAGMFVGCSFCLM